CCDGYLRNEASRAGVVKEFVSVRRPERLTSSNNLILVPPRERLYPQAQAIGCWFIRWVLLVCQPTSIRRKRGAPDKGRRFLYENARFLVLEGKDPNRGFGALDGGERQITVPGPRIWNVCNSIFGLRETLGATAVCPLPKNCKIAFAIRLKCNSRPIRRPDRIPIRSSHSKLAGRRCPR